MKAFIGRNLDEKDDDLINKIQEFIETYDIECIGGKRSESKPISQKVKERIESCDIFVGVFTHKFRRRMVPDGQKVATKNLKTAKKLQQQEWEKIQKKRYLKSVRICNRILQCLSHKY